jgi:DNA repair exonuclease SbcCD ATPase subunit
MVGVALGLLGACRSAPHESVAQSAGMQCRDPQLDALAVFAQGLPQQDAAALTAERDRLEAAPPSADRDLRLALLLGQQGSPLYDPQAAATLLTRVSSSAPADSAQKTLAGMLSATLPGGPQRCSDSDQVRELAAQLSVEQQKRAETAARLDSVRQELDAERAQRAKLEQQLEALKSLEEQIKNRDNEPGR